MPFGPHGFVQEVTAPNVAPEKVLFPKEVMDKADAACGTPQMLRAIRMAEGTVVSEELKRGWKKAPITSDEGPSAR